MSMSYRVTPEQRAVRWKTLPLLIVMLLSFSLFLTACGGDAHLQQQASNGKTQLDALLTHAQQIGVPVSLLHSILTQEQQISSTNAPFNLFSDQPANDYYHNLITRYSQLQVQTQGLVSSYTEQSQTQAQRAVQDLQTAITQGRTQKLPVQNFAQQFTQYQSLLTTAKYPKDYATIIAKATTATQAVNLMQNIAAQLSTLNTTIGQMQQANLDVTIMQTQYQSDIQALGSGKQPLDFQNLSTLIDAQYQQAVVSTTQALPYVTAAKLNQFAQQVQQLKSYGIDTSVYQKRLLADQALMASAKTIHDFQAFSQQVNTDIASMHNDVVQGEAIYLVKQFHQEVNTWGNAHMYHNAFDGKNYVLDAGYTQPGIGSDLDNALAQAYTPTDFQSVIDEANNALFNLHLLEADYNDKTPYNQVHATDLQMIQHYGLQKGQLLMVSLSQQAMRVYQDGKLVNSFLVTTGRNELPSVPGVWPVLDRQSPTVFKSSEPPGSPYWYPDTPIHYAILYHWGGYFVHDSWWRADYGPGTQFPHVDSGGDQSFAGSGSHGCVNMQEQQAAWVYANTTYNTLIVIY